MTHGAVWARLEADYSAPGRHYHRLAHIEDCLARLEAHDGLSDHERTLLRYAVWWHDVVYDPTRSDNEERSADRAKHDLAVLGVETADRDEVARLIRLTKGHEVAPGDRLGAVLVSIDLSILGASEARYDAYAAAIRAEYAFVPEDAYRAGRAAVMRKFLEAPVLFPDPALRAELEAQARANIVREIAALKVPPPQIENGRALEEGTRPSGSRSGERESERQR